MVNKVNKIKKKSKKIRGIRLSNVNRDEWPSCQIDVNKLVQRKCTVDVFSPEEAWPDETSDVADIKENEDIKLENLCEIIDEVFKPDENYTETYDVDQNERTISPTDTQPDVWVIEKLLCRCCHADGQFISLQDMDPVNNITYEEMLATCYSIELLGTEVADPLRALCGLCAARLRDAHALCQQVRACEARFRTLYSNNCVRVAGTAELEIKEESADTKDDEAFGMDADGYSSDHTFEDKVAPEQLKETSTVSKPRKKPVPKQKSLKTLPEPVAGTAELEIKEESADTKDVEDKVAPEQLKETSTISKPRKKHVPTRKSLKTLPEPVAVTQLTRLPGVKQVSERKRIRMTCKYVLLYTTACPFRHHRSWFQCFFCKQMFMEITALRLHTTQTHTHLDEEIKKLKRYPCSLQIDITDLQCKRCNLNLGDVETMRLHLDDIHNQVIYKEYIADYKVNSSPYSCHICCKQFHVFRTLTSHLNEHYANFVCDNCGKSFINSTRLKLHKRTHVSGPFRCSRCLKVFKTKASKAIHMESHSKRVIKCEICSKLMKHYNDRDKHMSEEHNITHKFKCPQCPREYKIKHYLTTHIRRMHGDKDKECAECGMAFVTNHRLNKHMQKHNGVKNLSCDVCSKAYVRSHALRKHMRIHDII